MIETIVKCDACGIKQDYEASLREHWYEARVHGSVHAKTDR
jgi:hypothetical protein